MKTNKPTSTEKAIEFIAALIGGLVLGLILGTIIAFSLVKNILPKVQLPEDYQLITNKDTLSGYYNVKDKTLYIDFANKRNK